MNEEPRDFWSRHGYKIILYGAIGLGVIAVLGTVLVLALVYLGAESLGGIDP